MRQHLQEATSQDVLSRDEIEGATVVSADNVADYTATFETGTNLVSYLDRVAPPFDRTFVEVQGRPNRLDLRAWGVLFSHERIEDDAHEDRGWAVHGALVAEWTKGRPVGPVVRWKISLDSQGRVRPIRDEPWTLPEGIEDESRSKGLGTLLMVPFEIPGVDAATYYGFASSLVDLLAPALFAISLMHCKNVDIHAVDPADRLSRKHARKSGDPLTRYYVLDINPMRRILDTEGEAETKGLPHALHLCRGHFKTFTEDAPLFGKHAGTFWWESRVRGRPEMGAIEKDYRVRLDQGLGREYVEADEHPEIKPNAPEHTGLDPDLGGRGLRAHNITQNLLASAVEAAGYSPRRPKPDEPQFDLAWDAGEVVWVAEVKSITAQNEERQLRLAVGQVMRYRQLLASEGRHVRAMIATEREPNDTTWADLCEQEAITLVWPAADGSHQFSDLIS
jgi:hypothetical protein